MCLCAEKELNADLRVGGEGSQRRRTTGRVHGDKWMIARTFNSVTITSFVVSLNVPVCFNAAVRNDKTALAGLIITH